jgi:AraC-like DNA-binding protein
VAIAELADHQVAEGVVYRPPALLRPYVESYVGYRYAGFPAGEHMGLPSRHLTFVISFDAPLQLSVLPGGGEGVWTYDALLGGLHTSPAVIRHDGSQHGIQLQVTPAGARALFGLPAGEVAGIVVPLDAIWGRLAGELLDRLSGAAGWGRRFAVLDGVLLRALASRVELPSGARRETTAAWDRLTTSAGRVGVATLAEEVGWSRRHLTERFSAEYGLNPRSLAKVLRFERARRLLVRADRPTLAVVAAACGYSDQAHMVHDWHALAGSSPTGWLESEVLPFVQDEEPPDWSEWTA